MEALIRRLDRRPSPRFRSFAALLVGVSAMTTLVAREAKAQSTPAHRLYNSQLPPGAIGQMQLERGGPRAGYFQPVELIPPKGGSVAVAGENGFQDAGAGPLRVGLLIGEVYRFRVTGIPGNEGLEVYPTIEVIDRLYPPPGMETRFPIPVELTRDELEYALDGKLVTRVIYLENPLDALPVREEPGKQSYFEVRATQDPLHVADELGRPMAILRMGSRIPSANDSFGSRPAPPAMVLPREEEPLHSFEFILPGDPRIELLPPSATVPLAPLQGP